VQTFSVKPLISLRRVIKKCPNRRSRANAETIEAMKAVRRGDVTTVHSEDELFASLNADD